MGKKLLSSKEVIKTLNKYFNFHITRQKGSHIKLQKNLTDRVIATIVPNQKKIAQGTLLGILKLAEVDKKEFFNKT